MASCFPCFPKPLVSVEDISNKTQFIEFVKKACSSTATVEYKLLYKFLLKVFRQADRDFDGLVCREDFDLMVEMAGAIPRNFGFAPTSVEQFGTAKQRAEYRRELFKKIDVHGRGNISFNDWLSYTYSHIQEKVKSLDSNVQLHMDTQDHFSKWVVAACRDRKSVEYKDLYNYLLAVFVEADGDNDGLVRFSEFDQMIEIAAAAPRKFGYAPATKDMHKSADDRLKHRKDMFDAMDTDKSGTITFEEWLTFSYTHICSKAKTLDDTMSGKPPPVTKCVESSSLGSW